MICLVLNLAQLGDDLSKACELLDASFDKDKMISGIALTLSLVFTLAQLK